MTLELTNTWVSGQSLTPEDLNENFTEIENVVNEVDTDNNLWDSIGSSVGKNPFALGIETNNGTGGTALGQWKGGFYKVLGGTAATAYVRSIITVAPFTNFEGTVKLSEGTNNTAAFGLSDFTNDEIRFHQNGTDAFASVTSGGSNTTAAQSTDWSTVSNLKCEWNTGLEAKFYDEGVLIETITVNVPSNEDSKFGYFCIGNGTADSTSEISKAKIFV